MSETNLEQFRDVTPAGRFTLQNSSLLKVRLEDDRVQAKLGSMVAYQGSVRFEHQGRGLGRFFKKALTGEGVRLMSATGTGDLLSRAGRPQDHGDRPRGRADDRERRTSSPSRGT